MVFYSFWDQNLLHLKMKWTHVQQGSTGKSTNRERKQQFVLNQYFIIAPLLEKKESAHKKVYGKLTIIYEVNDKD